MGAYTEPISLSWNPGAKASSRIDEDALARAIFGRRHDAGLDPRQLAGNGDGALPLAGVVSDPLSVMDVADPVLEDEEGFRAMIDAQAIAGTEILVDPHPEVGHGVRVARRLTLFGCSGEAQEALTGMA